MKTQDEPETSLRVTIGQASAMLGMSQTKVRQWLNEPGFAIRNAQGWWLIDRVALLAKAASESSPTDSRRVGAVTSPRATSQASEVNVSPQRDVTDERIRDLQETLARERRINDELRAENRNLQALQTQHLAELRALLDAGTKDKSSFLSRWIRT